MASYALDRFAGVIFDPGTLAVGMEEFFTVFPSHEEAEEARRELLPQVEVATTEAFTEALGAAAEGGYSRASASYPVFLKPQMALLERPEGREALVAMLLGEGRPWKAQQLAKALAWSLRQQAEEAREMPQRLFAREVAPQLAGHKGLTFMVIEALNAKEPWEKEALTAACDLWMPREAPFHSVVQRLLHLETPRLGGYTPTPFQEALRHENSEVVASFGCSISDLPDNLIAYDIETDTAQGYGLRPSRGQITEIVVATRETSWVFSGDERFILESFRDLLNVLTLDPQYDHIVGWNNHSFDDVYVQTRALLHGIQEWRGFLKEAVDESPYTSVAPSGQGYALTWVAPPGGVAVLSMDLFRVKYFTDFMEQGKARGLSLKSYTKGLGCSPVKVDRAQMHVLTHEERGRYALSDGLMTLRAALDICEEAEDQGLLQVFQR